MNRTALRYAARQYVGYVILLISAIYFTCAALIPTDRISGLSYGTVTALVALLVFALRYREGVARHEREQADQQHLARMNAMLARHQDRLDAINSRGGRHALRPERVA